MNIYEGCSKIEAPERMLGAFYFLKSLLTESFGLEDRISSKNAKAGEIL